MSSLLDTTIEDLLSGTIIITTKVIKYKTYYVGERRVKGKTATYYYAKNIKTRDEINISKKIREQYEQLLINN